MQISDLGLSRRTKNCLYRAGIKTVEELREKRTRELQRIRSFGAKSLQEVQEALERLEATKPKTRADHFRAMSDEELAEFFLRTNDTGINIPFCQNRPECIKLMDDYLLEEALCKACMLEWLRQPAKEGEL